LPSIALSLPSSSLMSAFVATSSPNASLSAVAVASAASCEKPPSCRSDPQRRLMCSPT
jgi:hypothetical protein